MKVSVVLVSLSLVLIVAVNIVSGGSCNPATAQCNDKGNFKRKQCGLTKCWCVKRKSGEPAYGGQEVPKGHPYTCKRKPKKCLREELNALIVDSSADVPECDSKGFYELKQCDIVSGERCAGLGLGGPCVHAAELGFDPVDRSKLDAKPLWTMVQKASFTRAGFITGFEVYVGATGNPLQIGVYGNTGTKCKFVLKEDYVWTATNTGYKKVMLSSGDWLPVDNGDRVGISWSSGSVVDYRTTATANNYCDKEAVYTVGNTAELDSKANGKREYSIRFMFQSYIGEDPVDRANLDRAMTWTMVDKTPLPTAGEVEQIELYAGANDKDLFVGVYRPVIDTSCEFNLVKQIKLENLPMGFVKVKLTGSDILVVEAYDHIGFTWKDSGVVKYDPIHTNKYCEKEAVYNEGDHAKLDMTHGKRDYSFRVLLKQCTHETCRECYCVSKRKGVEQEGTRTTGPLVC